MSEKYLWVEKYAPQTISDCILPTTLKKEFQDVVDTGEISNMLLIGEAGVGKTTVAKILCEVLDIDMMFINSSSERGIDEVRTKIATFASTSSLYGAKHKVILLDEADNLTPDAQKALRALIEEHQNHCRFVLTCNYPYKLIDPLRGRLQEIWFNYPTDSKSLKDKFTKRAIKILMDEKVKLEKENLKDISQIVEMSYPNWRKAIHTLQRCTKKGVMDQSLLQSVRDQQLSTLFGLLKGKKFTEARNWLAENFQRGISDTQLIDQIYQEPNMKKYIKEQSWPQLVMILGEYQHKASLVSNHELNAMAMCVEIMMECEFK